ncbi:ABC-type multidrug transport system, permease component [Gottschalkia purinilytica]|uniref:ABC-type multidrug transport system, permease component n=1 Tax=Gottschalkia purinilytica TaxID=1503 RepID=A0A0L0W9T5_GOTPU|nr:ABC transporter permease [Gottschalkia purinilytica]KNF08206.1 ABC-type multidrug transport system, permease component [Gottschalkia purinilytica]
MLSILKLRIMIFRHEMSIMLIMTLLALGMAFIAGSAQNAGYVPKVAIVDSDNSQYSKMMVEELKKDNSFRYNILSYKNGLKSLESNEVFAVVNLEKGFGESLKDNRKIEINLMKIKEDINTMTLENILKDNADKVFSNIKIAKTTSKYLNSDKFEEAYNKSIEGWKYKNPFEIKKEVISGSGIGNYDNAKHIVIGFSLFFSMYTIVFSVGDILRDKQLKTWQRALVSPISNKALLGGNLIVSFIIGLFQVSIILFGGKYLFNLDLGNNMLAIFIVISCFVFVTVSLGLFLVSILKNQRQLSAVSPIALTATSMLGGCMWPLDIISSKIILALANITPQKWAVEGIEKIAMYGYDVNSIIVPCLVLIGMGIVYFTLGCMTMKYE